MRLIDADAIEKWSWQEPKYHDSINDRTDLRDFVRSLPTIDPESLRARGKWLTEYEPNGRPYQLHCSVCDSDFSQMGITHASNYCPNCGAKMEGAETRDYEEQVKELRDFSEEFDLEDHTETAAMLANAADAIEELQAQVPHWISVEERLPEKHKVVIFYIPWNKTNMIGWIDEGGDINLEGYGRCYGFSLIKPSHWMPIPEPPKEVE